MIEEDMEDRNVALDAMVRQSPEAVVLTDTHGAVQSCSPRFLELFPPFRDGWVDKAPCCLFDFLATVCSDHKTVHCLQDKLEQIRAHAGIPGPARLRFDHPELVVDVTACPCLSIHGQMDSIIWSFRVACSSGSGHPRRQHIEKMEAISRLAGGMAHEFNNLLTAVLGNLEIMRIQQTQTVTSVLPRIDSAESAALRMSRLIQDLRRFGSREMPQTTVQPIGPVVDRAVQLFSAAVAREIRIEWTFDTEDVFADVSDVLLEDAIMQLALNARDAIGRNEGSVRFEMTSREDEMTGSELVCISITDTGCGMAEDTQMMAFEPFFTTKDPGESTGLGLAKAYGVMEEMGGRIHIDSSTPSGTTVSLLLPRCVNTVSPQTVSIAAK